MPKPIPILSPSQLRRMWELIDARPIQQCWPWLGRTDDGGYAHASFHPHGNFRITRVILTLATGQDPGELFALHLCENDLDSIGRICVNPCHLRAGTTSENMLHCSHKIKKAWRESTQGELHPRAKLTNEQIREIVRRREAGDTTRNLAEEFGVVPNMISKICKGDTWNVITGLPKRDVPKRKWLSEISLDDILLLRGMGASQREIALIFGVSQPGISLILRHATRSPIED